MPASKDSSAVAVECAQALVALKDAEGLRALERGIEAWTGYYESKQMDPMRYSDWRRATTVLIALAEAWATLAPADAKADVLGKTVVARVLAAQDTVQTSSRVPQDPAANRAALARAVAQAYKRTNAPAGLWDKPPRESSLTVVRPCLDHLPSKPVSASTGLAAAMAGYFLRIRRNEMLFFMTPLSLPFSSRTYSAPFGFSTSSGIPATSKALELA